MTKKLAFSLTMFALAGALWLTGCSLQAPSAVDVRLISEHYEGDRAHLKYEVLCPADVASDTWRPVDYYGHIILTDFGGFVFESKEALLEYEYKYSCRNGGDGEGKGPENADDE